MLRDGRLNMKVVDNFMLCIIVECFILLNIFINFSICKFISIDIRFIFKSFLNVSKVKLFWYI